MRVGIFLLVFSVVCWDSGGKTRAVCGETLPICENCCCHLQVKRKYGKCDTCVSNNCPGKTCGDLNCVHINGRWGKKQWDETLISDNEYREETEVLDAIKTLLAEKSERRNLENLNES